MNCIRRVSKDLVAESGALLVFPQTERFVQSLDVGGDGWEIWAPT